MKHPPTSFDFGENWKSFSEGALDSERVVRARVDFGKLFEGIALTNQTFLDIGFGQGLAICLASEVGAKCFGNEINLKCVDALKSTGRFFSDVDLGSIPVVVGSILDEAVIDRLRLLRPGGYDIVHSWGALHHTGEMKRAIRHAASLVAVDGHFIIAIYNSHWSSPIWNVIKATYVRIPTPGRPILVALMWPLIFIAKLLITRRNPLQKERGMSFYHDVVDWIGGYPYEYASVFEIKTFLESLGFRLERAIPANVPTGCNQFVFKRV